ncbi:MAG: Trk system potassium transporter TrkA [Deltaproteobacteria bacterium]|nr:Trk system potassium transporter TrkA [Deltaproteobacteria bacterium]
MARKKRGQRSENILILGLGGVGYYLAKRLSHEGYAITVIEADAEKLRRADSEIDARLIRGDALSYASYREAAIEDMDYLIAVTDNDAVNVFASQVAEKVGVRCKIARVRTVEVMSDDAILGPDDFHIDMVIRPGELTAREIARLLQMRSGNVVIEVGEGQLQVMAVRVEENSPLSHRTLKQLSKEYESFNFRVVAIARGINTLIPGGDIEILPFDHVYILAPSDRMDELMKMANVTDEGPHRVMIVGGGLVGRRVAQLLEGTWPVTLVERDEHRAEELTWCLKRTTVLHGDGSHADTLIQAGLLKMDTIICATSDNETNIMTSVMAKHLFHDRKGNSGVGRTIALVNREEYQVLASTIGADIVLNHKVLAGNRILKYVRRGHLLNVSHLHGCDAEVVELVAEPHSSITRRPLAEVGTMKDRIILAGVMRESGWKVAIGSTHIRAGDTVVAICASDRLPDLQRLFRHT